MRSEVLDHGIQKVIADLVLLTHCSAEYIVERRLQRVWEA